MEFLYGANLPWIRYGIDFGANAWCREGGVGRHPGQLDADFRRLAEAGVRAARWFLFCDGRSGIRFDASGAPMGLDDFVIRDLDAAVDCADRHGVRLIFVLMDYLWCEPISFADGVQIGGRSAVLQSSDLQEALLTRVFKPVLERFAAAPAILAWDIMNEPEWIAKDMCARGKPGAIDPEPLHSFFEDAIALIHGVANQPVTIGSAGAHWRKFYRGLDLDFYQVHWYDTLPHVQPLETPVEQLGFDRPVLLGEFPTRGSRHSIRSLLAAAELAGYCGALYWSALSDDACSDRNAADRGLGA